MPLQIAIDPHCGNSVLAVRDADGTSDNPANVTRFLRALAAMQHQFARKKCVAVHTFRARERAI
jgi:hypothetical protein